MKRKQPPGTFDEFEWCLRLIVVDRFGNEHEVDLMALAFKAPSPVQVWLARRHYGVRDLGESPDGLR